MIFQRLSTFISRYRPLLLILLVVFILRIPSLFEPHRYADEEIYLTLGQGLRHGLVFYKDIHDNKPPLLYLVAAVAGSLFWLRFALLAVHALGVIIFWKLAELLFPQRRWAVFASTIFFALFSSLPFLEGNIANGENFMIVPALGGVYLFYRTLTRSQHLHLLWTFPLIGFLFAVAFLFKVPIVFDFLGLFVFWVLLSQADARLGERLKIVFSRPAILMSAGFFIPVIASILYYSFHGAFEPYVRSALMQNIGYLSSWRNEASVFGNPLVWRGLCVFGIIALLFVFSKRLSRPVRFIIIWTAFSMYGALLSSRPYPHYLLEPLVPVSFLVVLFFSQKSVQDRLSLFLMIAVIVLVYFENGFWYYKTIPYYQNFIRYISGSQSRDDYFEFWGVRRNYEIAAYLRERTVPSDRIFVWGTEPSIYTLSERLPVGRYAVSYHIHDFRAYDETLSALHAFPPAYMVIIDDFHEFNSLKSFLDERYFLETSFDSADLYRLGS